MTASDHLGAQFDLYHGTPHELNEGDTINPGSDGYAYASEDPEAAKWVGDSRAGKGATSRLYRVERIGTEPEDTVSAQKAKRESNYAQHGATHMSSTGFRVVGDVTPNSDADELEVMRKGMEAKKRLGIWE